MKAARQISLKDYTTIKIGGQAKNFFFADNLKELLAIVNKVDGSFHLLGNGSNLLIKDSGVDKIIIKLGKDFDYIKISGDFIEIGAATLLGDVLNYCVSNNLTGLENLAGIPATIGGMLAMNASSFKTDITSCLETARIIDRKGQIREIAKKDIKYGYRFSSLKNNIILSGCLRLRKSEGVASRIKNFFQQKLEKQDCLSHSCGCVFKNPKDYAAGFLIEDCGLKGYCYNNAKFSNMHANFIINLGNTSYADVDYLIQLAKDKVYAKYRIILEEEIERW